MTTTNPRPLAKLVSFLTPKRRWVQFRLRTLMLLVAAVAVPCGLYKWMWEPKRRERAAAAEIQSVGGRVEFEHGPEPVGSGLFRYCFGEDFYFTVTFVSINENTITEHAPLHLGALTGLKELSLHYNAAANDACLQQIKWHRELVKLNLDYTGVTDAGMSHLEKLIRLEVLYLCGTDVSDAGVVHIKGLTALRSLQLRRTHITDAGLTNINGLIRLEVLDLRDSAVTAAGVAELQKSLPTAQSMGLSDPKRPRNSPSTMPRHLHSPANASILLDSDVGTA